MLQVLRAVVALLPSVSVRAVVMDYEAATWKAFASVLQTVEIRGCFFHYGQAVWRKVQELGMCPVHWVTLYFRLDQVLNSVLDQSLNWTQKSGFRPMLRLSLVLD